MHFAKLFAVLAVGLVAHAASAAENFGRFDASAWCVFGRASLTQTGGWLAIAGHSDGRRKVGGVCSPTGFQNPRAVAVAYTLYKWNTATSSATVCGSSPGHPGWNIKVRNNDIVTPATIVDRDPISGQSIPLIQAGCGPGQYALVVHAYLQDFLDTWYGGNVQTPWAYFNLPNPI